MAPRTTPNPSLEGLGILRLQHIGIPVTNLAASTAFYARLASPSP